MSKFSLMTVFVECQNSTCILYKCVIRKRKGMHNGISSYLPTGRAGDTTMVWVRKKHTTQREGKQRSRTEGQKKRKKWKSEMDEVELGFHPWSSGTRRVSAHSPKHGDGKGPQGNGTLATLGGKDTNAENPLKSFVSKNTTHSYNGLFVHRVTCT